ncbi:hypothetical protein [Paenibacillus sp. JZ16]|uniref:hypothetical protein n=1 Tax=Paenibacillus sp. JZ16 TaxID=1906272 RepID=UPI00188AAF0B|nr:hypothetical protein [Paenibacillus sp. JZ16]
MITKIPDGTLVHDSGSAVFLIEHGQKRPIMDIDSFYFYKLMARKIIPLEDMLLNLYPLGEGVTVTGQWAKCAPATLFVKGGGSGIFLWMDNCLFPIQSGEVFQRLRCQMDEIVHVPDSLVQSLQIGHTIDASFFFSTRCLTDACTAPRAVIFITANDERCEKWKVPPFFPSFNGAYIS